MNQTRDVSLGMHMLELEITHGCNLNCQMCYIHNPCSQDMPFLLVSRLIDFAFEHGVIDLVITGGEPLLHPDFKAISECVRLRQNSQHSTRVVIQTNGILIDEKIIPYLRCFDFVHLSFDVVEG